MGAEAAIAIGAGSSLAGGIIQGVGAGRAADAAQNAANAQAAEAARQRELIVNQGKVGQQLAEATPQELAILDRSYSSAGQQLDRQQKLLDAIDPSLMEASKQALGLLRGENAGITGAVNAQRDQQRKQLVDSLRSAYGPGAETSSIGQKALQSFDMQSNTMTQQNNMGALNQLWGMTNTDTSAGYRAGLSQFMQTGQGYGAIQDRRLNANNSLMGALAGTAPSMINAAGAPWAGDALRGQGMAALGGGVMNAGLTGLTYGLMAGAKALPGTPAITGSPGMTPQQAAMVQAPSGFGPAMGSGYSSGGGFAAGMGTGGGLAPYALSPSAPNAAYGLPNYSSAGNWTP